ncbi:AAA family ATPase, partial [Devosia sp.]|uniref:AAA family ATPase n=1 Tax=Devosia sp. TaxID=1871048 RepID=UPI001ACEEB6E
VQDLADVAAGRLDLDSVDRGAIIHGPTGTGKTTFARMLAAECKLPLITTSFGELFATHGGYLHAMIKGLREVFDAARAAAPCLVFIDECNALPDVDSLEDSKNGDYWKPLIFDFYLQLDGAMSNRDGIVVIGATNRLQDINKALLRPGRLERSIYLGPPDAAGAERIMRHHLSDDLVDVDIGRLSEFNARREATGAVIMEQVRAARRLARRANRAMVVEDIEAQVITEDRRTPVELRRAAAHEAGHVIATVALGIEEVLSATIQQIGDSGGAVATRSRRDAIRTREEYEGKILSLLAGRAAEEILIGSPSHGAGGSIDSDLAKSTVLAAALEGSLGLGDTLTFRGPPETMPDLLALDPLVRVKVGATLERIYGRAIDLLKSKAASLDAMVDALMERRFLTGEDIDSLLASATESSSQGLGNDQKSRPARIENIAAGHENAIIDRHG